METVMRYIFAFIMIVTLAYGDEFPLRLPNVRQNFRAGDLIQYNDANHLGRTVNALCEKVGINNTHLYGNRYTNTLDFKIYHLWYNAISNNLRLAELETQFGGMGAGSGGGGGISNHLFDVLYITKSPVNTNKFVGLRLYYQPSTYVSNVQIGYQLYVFEEAVADSVTNTVLINEFENEMRFYAYSDDDSDALPQRSPGYVVMKLVAPSTNPDGSIVGGGAYFGHGIVFDDRNFITNNNNYFTIKEQEKYYAPIVTSNQASIVEYYYTNPTNWYGSFLIFKPKPQGITKKMPVGYEFLDDEGVPAFTIRGKLNLSGWITNIYQYWVADFHFIKVTGIPDPLETEVHDAVSLGFLNKEFDRRIRLYQMNLLDFNPLDQLQGFQYYNFKDKHYYNTLSRIYVNAVISTGMSINVFHSNLVMHTFTTQNNLDDILITYDSVATNAFIGGMGSYPINFTFTGVMIDPFNVIPNIYGIKSRTEYTGVVDIPANQSSVEVKINPYENESGQTVIPNVVTPDTAILVTPYKTPLVLYYYWVEYISNNAFRICLDAPQPTVMTFKWIVPHVLTASYNTIDYPKNRVVLGSPVTVVKGSVSSEYARVGTPLTNYWLNTTKETIIFTPIGFSTNSLGQTNLFSWYQNRNFRASSPARVVVDSPPTRDIKFNWAIFKQ